MQFKQKENKKIVKNKQTVGLDIEKNRQAKKVRNFMLYNLKYVW